MRMTIWYQCDECELETAQPRGHGHKSGHTGFHPVRWDQPRNYDTAHRLTAIVRGLARDQQCACGKPARGWALRRELHVFREMRWSTDPADYVALCDLCHKRQDWLPEEWRANALKARAAAGRRGGNVLREKRRADPELDQAIRAVMSANGKHTATTNQAQMQAGLAKKRENPEFERKFQDDKRRAGRIANSARWECVECGLVSSAPGLGHHQRSSGHVGRLPSGPQT